MRLDKFLVECGVGSRSEVKKIISSKKIVVNGTVEKNGARTIDEKKDEIIYLNKKIEYKKYRYYIMYKIAGYITATEDKKEKTVMELLPVWVNKKDLFPVGRLDKDTEGLLLFTNDGKKAHELTSPKKHVDKKYYVELKNDISEEDIEKLEKGVDIGGYITKESKVEKIDSKKIYLTISEGKFHQVKKMLIAVKNEVLYLKRESFGKLKLKDMKPGEVIEISIDCL